MVVWTEPEWQAGDLADLKLLGTVEQPERSRKCQGIQLEIRNFHCEGDICPGKLMSLPEIESQRHTHDTSAPKLFDCYFELFDICLENYGHVKTFCSIK